MKIKRLLWSILQPALAFKICFVSYEIFIVNYKKNNFYQINLFRYIINSFQVITSQFKNDLYRYLTDIHQFKTPFMAKNIRINPKKCANSPGETWGCGVRWEILGNSKGLFDYFLCF